MDYRELRSLIKNKEKHQDIINKTRFLDSFYKKIPIRQRLWHVDNNVYELCTCNVCKTNYLQWNEKSGTYRTYCSSKCAHQSQLVKEKTATTCIERYGVKTTLQTAKVKEQIKQTLINKYGVDNPSKSDIVKGKIKQTFLKNYGVDNPSKVQAIKDQINTTHLNRYNRKRFSQVHIPNNIIDIKNNRELMYQWHVVDKMPIQEIAELLNISHSQLCIHFKNNLNIGLHKHLVSTVEKDITAFFKSFDVEVVCSDRTILSPKEIDILIPTLNLGIEVDGLLWHTENRGKHKFYHKDKSTLASEKNISLIHITDYEWKNKQDIVKSRLIAKIGKANKIYARKCSIVPLSSAQAKEFVDNTHIQGSCSDSIRLGLTFNNELVAVMTFGKPRFNRNYEWELLRYSNKLNTTVIGGASKLFRYFVKNYNPTSVVSYSDNRWNSGTVYSKLGFTLINDTEPNYWYTYNFRTFESRVKYQKHKLHKVLKHFDPTKTEWENMVANGYDRFWDCGNKVFLWKKPV